MTMKPILVCAGTLAALLGLIGAAPTPAAQERGVQVFFLQGEQLVAVTRPGTSTADAVRQLLAGPRRTDAARGIRTYVPKGTALRRLNVTGGLATIDVSSRFTTEAPADRLSARLAQLVRTVTGSDKGLAVQLLVEGKKVSGVFPGVPTETPITFRFLQTPSKPVPSPPRVGRAPVGPAVRIVQRRLIQIGYLPPGSADGRLGAMTEEAILAFQKWERLPRTGALDTKTKARLPTASQPTPVLHNGTARRIEVLLDRQVALLIQSGEVVSAIAVSTGKASTPTPPGHYRVYAKIPRWWSTPFREWLPWAVPFVGGIAFHQYLSVPAYPASHGCVRQVPAVARVTYNFAEVGMPVDVIGRT
jgi:L,D-transpeptidase-like protein/putative peptidoglycan binding protein/sporulation and spore germination protein